MFEIRINNRQLMTEFFSSRYGITDPEILKQITNILDRKKKVTSEIFQGLLENFVQGRFEQLRNDLDLDIDEFIKLINTENQNATLTMTKRGLESIGIKNIVFDATLARGFNYYTGTIFEIFDTDPNNNRSLIGGGRYDNLTSLFGGEPISGIGFGMGDVTMRDFLETHDLLKGKVPVTAPTLIVIPMEETLNIEAEKIAHTFRLANVRTSIDLSTKKIGKKIGDASESGVTYILVVGEKETETKIYTLKELATTHETNGSIDDLIRVIG
jgi:histidyl-tRNA synthetase